MYETLAVFVDGKYLGSETLTGEGSYDHAEAAVRAFKLAMDAVSPRPRCGLYHLRCDWSEMVDKESPEECEKAWWDHDD